MSGVQQKQGEILGV